MERTESLKSKATEQEKRKQEMKRHKYVHSLFRRTGQGWMQDLFSGPQPSRGLYLVENSEEPRLKTKLCACGLPTMAGGRRWGQECAFRFSPKSLEFSTKASNGFFSFDEEKKRLFEWKTGASDSALVPTGRTVHPNFSLHDSDDSLASTRNTRRLR